jgi:hypothetical protein
MGRVEEGAVRSTSVQRQSTAKNETPRMNLRALRLLTALLLSPLTVLHAESAPPIVGAIRSDAWYGEGGVVKQTELALSPPKYHFRLPWFARLAGEGKVRINGDSQEIVEKAIACAGAAGLNYCAFVDYCDDANLSIALRRYRAAKEKRGVRYCFVRKGSNRMQWARAAGLGSSSISKIHTIRL